MSDLSARSRWLATAIVVALIVIMLLFSGQVLQAGSIEHLSPFFWASLLPVPLYLYAIGAVWRTLLSIAEGKRKQILGRMLNRVGYALLIGSLLEIFGVALLDSLLGGGGPLFNYDLTAITIGVLGTGLTIVAKLMEEAEQAKAELEEFV